MSRRRVRVVEAPLAITSSGEIIANVVCAGAKQGPRALLETALAEGGAVFVGVVVSAHETSVVRTRLDDASAEAASVIFGRRHRRRLSLIHI